MSKILLTTTGTGTNPLLFNDMGAMSITHPTTDFEISRYVDISDIKVSQDLQTALSSGWVTLKDDNLSPITGTLSYELGYVVEREKVEAKWNANKLIDVEIDDTNKGLTSSQVLSYNTTTSKIEYQTLNYIHYQSVPAAIWTVTHNMSRFPSVTVVDAGNNVIEGCIKYNSNSEVLLEFTAPFSGKAYLT